MRKLETKYKLADLQGMPKGEGVPIHVFMSAICQTDPHELAKISGIDRMKWYAFRVNYRKGSMSIDKQIELANALGADTSAINVVFNK